MKPNDKVCCIKNTYALGYGSKKVLIFEKNKVYKIVYYDDRDDSVAIEHELHGTWWYFIKDNINNKLFSNYFITQTQYRKQKLNLINNVSNRIN